MSGVRLAARLVLIVVFSISGLTKLVDHAGTTGAVVELGTPRRLATPVAWGLPAAELAAAALLAFAATAWWGGLLAFVLLAAFTVAIAVNLGQGRRPDCHCFGQWGSKPVSGRSIVRNVVLAVPAVLLVLTA